MEARRQYVTLLEQPDGWLYAQHGRHYKTLARAVSFINRDIRKVANSTGVVIAIFSYEPNTDQGTAEVNKLLKKQQQK